MCETVSLNIYCVMKPYTNSEVLLQKRNYKAGNAFVSFWVVWIWCYYCIQTKPMLYPLHLRKVHYKLTVPS